MNILILGANGTIARLVEQQILNDKAFADVKLTMFLRNAGRVDDLLSYQSSAMEGDLDNFDSLNDAVEDQDAIFDLTGATRSIQPTQNIIKAMQNNGVIRVISLNDLGIYDEVPGQFGKWNKKQLGKRLQIGRQTANIYETAEVDFTILRLAWLSNEPVVNYELTQKGEPFKGTTVSRMSVANIILRIIDDPDYLSGKNVGVSKPGTSGDTPIY